MWAFFQLCWCLTAAAALCLHRQRNVGVSTDRPRCQPPAWQGKKISVKPLARMAVGPTMIHGRSWNVLLRLDIRLAYPCRQHPSPLSFPKNCKEVNQCGWHGGLLMVGFLSFYLHTSLSCYCTRTSPIRMVPNYVPIVVHVVVPPEG